MADLRSRLREGVERSRREREPAGPRVGALSHFDDARPLHFTTTGRRTGEPRTKWWLPFAADGDVLYLLEENGTAAQWVQNILANPEVDLEGVDAVARIVEDATEEMRARGVCRARFERVGLVVADLVESGLVVAFEPR